MIEALQRIPLADIIPSKTNPRKTFTGPDWPEFVANIKAYGVIQPGVARLITSNPSGKAYELVCGERRLRASREAGLPDMPLVVRILTDAQAVELQQIENLQREDLSVLEEAQGYEDWCQALLQEQTAKTVEDAVAIICTKINKKRSHVFGRRALLKVSAPVKQALVAGELEPTKAQLIAQVPAAADQEELLNAALGKGDYDPMSYRQLKEEIETNYRISLTGAPFSVNEVYKGPKDMYPGACVACPHRSGNLPEPSGNPNVCGRPECFRLKCDAVAGTASTKCAAVWDEKTWKRNRYSNDYLRADDTCYEDAQGRSWAKVLGAHAPVPILAMGREFNNNDQEQLGLIAYYQRDEVYKIIKDKQLIKAKEKNHKPDPAEVKRQQERAERKAKQEAAEKALELRTGTIIGQVVGNLLKQSPVDFWSKLAATLVTVEDSYNDLKESLFIRRGLPFADDGNKNNIATLNAYIARQTTADKLAELVVEIILSVASTYTNDHEQQPSELARLQTLWLVPAPPKPATANKPVKAAPAKKLPKLNPKTKAKILAAQKVRWAKIKAAAKKGGAK